MESAPLTGPMKLVNFSCQVCSKTSVADAGNTSATCLLQFKVQDTAVSTNEQPALTSVTMELQRPALNALVDGLGIIRDQLSSVASTASRR